MIKRMLKAVLGRAWRSTKSVCRPLTRRLDNHLACVVRSAVQGDSSAIASQAEVLAAQNASLGRIEAGLQGARHVSEQLTIEANLLMDSLVREVARLQRQVEMLTEQLEEARSDRGLLIVSTDDQREHRRVG